MRSASRGSPPRQSRTQRIGDLALTPEIRALVTRVLGTVSHLDVSLALRRDAPRLCSLDDLARVADVPCGLVVRRCADALVHAGLATSPGGASIHRYDPSTSAVRQTADALADVMS